MSEIYLVIENSTWLKSEEDYGMDETPIKAFDNFSDAKSYAEDLIFETHTVLGGKLVDAPMIERLDGTKDERLLHRTKGICYEGIHEWFGEVDAGRWYDVRSVPFGYEGA